MAGAFNSAFSSAFDIEVAEAESSTTVSARMIQLPAVRADIWKELEKFVTRDIRHRPKMETFLEQDDG